ncbi:hypothetical protein GSI_14330 [Ganoderma sinense ZZ0214-1]|uniref:Uncharacterized protein n=1 Tax=Ganoderma sinense ZZ0214-1 TaxID=1077348 RepID=A0A2G8RNE6_9APHY|nr:hypothetical protein GSI_14330 [Ganoderma sinense ZZ0214-1]
MPHLPTGKRQNRRVHWSPCGSESTLCASSPDANPKDLHSPHKPPMYGDACVKGNVLIYQASHSVNPMYFTGVGIIIPVISTLHTVLAYFVFNWDVRATPLPDSLPKAARDEPAFPSLPFKFPQPVTIWFETPFGLIPCVINPLEHNGKPIPISVGRVLACISRDLYRPVGPGYTLLPAVRQAAASRPYDPEPKGRAKRVVRNVDLYPVYPARPGHGAPLFFWGIELQHCGGGAVRLVARFGSKALKV